MFNAHRGEVEDLYKTLHIERGASQNEIKQAYRKLALKYHPDKVKDMPKEKAEEQFKNVTRAYSILSDAVKKNLYDTQGIIDDGNAGAAGPMPDMNDILKQMFGENDHGAPFGNAFSFMFGADGSGPFGPGPGNANRPKEVMHISVSLDDVYQGIKKTIEIDIQAVCPHCDGSGAQDPSDIIKCIKCGGKGSCMQQIGPFMMGMTQCQSCFGNGTSIRNNRNCSKCKGQKTTGTKKSMEIRVPKGIPNNFTHVIKGAGSFHVQSKSNNDVVLVFVHNLPDANTKVDDHGNVYITMDLKLEELMAGFKRQMYLYKKPFLFHSNGYFNPSKNFIVPDMGLPVLNKSRHGNLVVTFNVIFSDDASKINKYHDVFLKVFKRSEETITNDEEKSATVLKIQ